MTRLRSRYSSRCCRCGRSWLEGDTIYGVPEVGWHCSIACAEVAVPMSPAAVEPWPVTMLRCVLPEWRDRVYRGLARTLHPDAGGDTQLAAALNAGRDRLYKEATR